MPTFIDIAGKRFGRLVVVGRTAGKRNKAGTRSAWICRCDCGKELTVLGDYLRSGHTKSCGCLRREHFAKVRATRSDAIIGRKFGRLTVKERYASKPSGRGSRSRWFCECDCGGVVVVYGKHLRNGNTQSCGCIKRGQMREWNWNRNKHGTPERCVDKSGYVSIYMPDHPNANSTGYVREHVLVMAEHVKRPLMKGETVHHKNGIRNDNRLANLELWVGAQPPGARAIDLLDWAREVVERYADLETKLR